jgi:phosphomannomutase
VAPPVSLGGLPVLSADDLTTGAGGLPPTDGLRYRLAEDARVVVRPSGTEPKLKCYLEAVVPVAGDLAAARLLAAGRLAAIEADLRAALAL